MKTVLVIGNGGREHALAWKLAQSQQVQTVYVAPGNGGTAQEPGCENININVTDVDGLKTFAINNAIDITVVGPEAPLVIGLVDAFETAGLAIFGPVQAAAQLEGSKAYAKAFFDKYQIPSARYDVFTETAPAKAFVQQMGTPIVIKADGLAAGKGVIIAETEQQAFDTIDDMLQGNAFGEAGSRVVIEQFLDGEEASFIVMVDGEHVLPMATSQDHKARNNGDQGPNTGGMGAYSPAPIVTEALTDKIMQQVIWPTVKGMVAEGHPYKGFLYAGLMISPQGDLNVLEFNCRFGDPETQPIMMRLESDLLTLIEAALAGQLNQVTAQWTPQYSVGVVLASDPYPNTPITGEQIQGLDHAALLKGKVFHAGTKAQNNQLLTSGGRVLCAVGLGNDLQQAQDQAYALVQPITWPAVFYRTDIGYKGIERLRSSPQPG